MEICDVSRPVIREALTSLEVMGIIHRKTRKGSFFAERIGSKPFSMMLALAAGDIQSIIEIRVALELGLVTLAAEKITDKDLQKLKEINERMKKLPTQDSTKEDKEFHKIIAMSANNPLFAGVITPLQQFHEKILGEISLKDRDLEETLRQHTLIYEALERRDPVAAYTAMYNHLNYARKKALKSIELKQQ